MRHMFGAAKDVSPEINQWFEEVIAVHGGASHCVVEFNGPTTKKGTDHFCQVFWEIGDDVFEGSCFTTGVS